VTPCTLVKSSVPRVEEAGDSKMFFLFWTTGNGVTSHKTAVLKDKTIYSAFSTENIKPLFLKKFYILLTVHHVVILGKWPTWCTNSFLCIYFYL
jgi:hypothetical protein